MTIRDIEARMRAFVGFPDEDSPNRSQRLLLVISVIDTHAKYVTALGRPHLIDRFLLPVSSGRQEYVIPVENFERIFYVTSNRFNREVELFNFPDQDLLRELRAGTSPRGATAGVLKLGWYGAGDARRLITFPANAEDELTVWYETAPPDVPGLDDSPHLMEQFCGVLIPLAAALSGMHLWRWSGRTPEETAVMKSEMLDAKNPASLRNLYLSQLASFKELSINPTVVHPSRRLQGHASRRRRLRRILG